MEDKGKSMLNICITFDYELFFGENFGTEREILFEPTEKLKNMLEKEGVSATFFADICSVIQSEKAGRTQYVEDFKQQIQELHKAGQDVQLHIHSNWLKSSWVDGRWEFDKKSYGIHSFGFDRKKEQNAYDVIHTGAERLREIVTEVDAQYSCIAYRAGGFVIQPHSELVKVLYENGIRVDCSVAPNLFSDNNTNAYDYRHPIESENWWLKGDKEWWQDAGETGEVLYEIPVGTENKNPVIFLFTRLLNPQKIKLYLGEKRGRYINESGGSNASKFSYWQYLSGYNAMSMDAYNADFIYKQLCRYYKKHQCADKDITISLIGHPKLINDIYIENLRKLIRVVKKDKRFCFCNVKDAYSKVLK